jgi:predicted component of type VI protein secretion system
LFVGRNLFMPPAKQDFGIMKPLGGGDPVPLKKTELIVGRRPSCDIVLNFENVSGKHCQLRFLNQVWLVRDLGSSNGTTVNGAPLTSEHSLMPDDELGIANHFYTIDYEPGAPDSVLNSEGFGDEEISEVKKKRSLMDLAGLEADEDRYKKKTRRPTKAPEVIERLSAEEGEFDDALPDYAKEEPTPVVETSDDDFLKLIQDDVEKPDPNKEP